MMYIENDQENDDGRKEAELKIELLKEQALSREFVRGIDRVLSKIRDIYSEKNKFDNRIEMIKKIEDLRKEKDFLKDILIKQMSTYSLLKSLHRYKTYNQNIGFNNRNSGIEPIEIEENMMSYEEIFPPKMNKNQPDQSLYKILNKLMKDRMYLLEKGIKIENVLSDNPEMDQYI
ncbi:hypothetical protein RS030_111918 [Cryptosporidium xiaoi]|uniref:Uncharacterized protein n=1 Tax=Cryptosporidium xiaoi TaxID=659607 RepID=A0AAV9Y2D2_9CRYT